MKIRCEYCDSVYEDAEFCPHCLAPRPGSAQAVTKPEPAEDVMPAVEEPAQQTQEPAVQEEQQPEPEHVEAEPIQPTYAQGRPVGRFSGMSIAALILAFIFPPIGIILAAVDIIRNRMDGRSHILSYGAIAVALLMMIEVLD